MKPDLAAPEPLFRPAVVEEHRQRWLADYWGQRSNPLISLRRARSGQRSRERGETAGGPPGVGWKR